MNKETMEWILQRLAKVHDFLEMWQGSQNLRSTQKESRSKHKLMAAIGYDFNTEEITKVSWLLFHPDDAAVFNCQKDHISHQIFLQRTLLEDELKS
jgi:hypothetical protein